MKRLAAVIIVAVMLLAFLRKYEVAVEVDDTDWLGDYGPLPEPTFVH